ncbi:hypothetical protein D3C78_980230 [compost metagenome]
MPVDTQGELFQLVDLVAGGIQAADHRAHAGAGNGIDLDALLFQGFEYADMGQATGGTARQHQADFRSWWFGGQEREGNDDQQQTQQQTVHLGSRS